MITKHHAFELAMIVAAWIANVETLDLTVRCVSMFVTVVAGIFAILHYIDARKASRKRQELDQLQIDKLKEERKGFIGDWDKTFD